jgi:hypothetical protein
MEIIPTTPTHKAGKQQILRFTQKPDYLRISIKANRARNISVASNHYNVGFAGGQIFQWVAKFDPELPEDSRQLVDGIMAANMPLIRKTLGFSARVSNTLFSFNQWNGYGDVKKFKFKQHPTHKLKLRLVKELDFDQIFNLGFERFEITRVINFQVKTTMRRLKYCSFGNDGVYYDTHGTV